MTSRRTFIKVAAALPAALSFRPAWATGAADPTRLALVIGNSSYQEAPLVNPANDARAVAGMFAQAGFTVDSRLDANRSDMVAAIERFGNAAKRSDTRLVVFYYAGHGAQLDWRNYLLPVDAVVQKQADLKERCVDLSLLLGQLSAARDKTFIIILDACRNNPFGSAYRPEQKGLSQFDAPVGSLLAYATAPGNVASDGDGQNGLYTEHLVRELSRRDTRIEDALKRVRLNVRLASKGEQVPWETTSLEGDVFIFNEGQKKLSETELEQMAEADIAEWTRIKSSKKTDDWVAYLRNFPNGRFAEIAQMRLARQLAETERLAAEERQRDELRRQEEQRKLAEQKRIEQEQRLAAERRQLEERQLKEMRRREEEQQRLEAKRKQEQERLDRERQRIVEAERLAEERRRQEEQRKAAEQKSMEREQIRIAEVQRLVAERKKLEEQQQQEQRQRQEEQRTLEAALRQEQERLDRERQRIAEAERLAAEQRRVEDERRRVIQEQRELAQAAPAQAAVSRPAPAALATAPALEIRAGLAVPQLIAPSANPFSAGRFPLGRIFTVGDSASIVLTDILTGIEERTRQVNVTRVDYDEDRVEYNNGSVITDLMGNALKIGQVEYESPVQWTPAEFHIGKKWTAAFRQTRGDRSSNAYYDMQIVKRETITVPAGIFDTFRIEGIGWNTTMSSRLELKLWLVPGINFTIRRELMIRNKKGAFRQTERQELVAMRQHARGTL